MRTRTRLTALGLVLVLVTSVGGAQVGMDLHSVTTSDHPVANPNVDTEASSANATTIESCTEINESGHYELAADLNGTQDGPCITITASDVVFDGNGHTIDTLGIGVRVKGTGTLTNVTVSNLRIEGGLASSTGTRGIEFNNVSDATVANYTFDGGFRGVYVENSSDVIVRDVDATGAESGHGSSHSGVLAMNSNNVRITDSEFRTFNYAIAVNGQNITVRNNTIYQEFLLGSAGEFGSAISVSATDSEIVGNDIIATDSGHGDGIRLSANTSNTRVAENTISFDGRSGVRVNTTGTDDASNVITNNTIESVEIGVHVVQNSKPLRVEHNEFSDTDTGIRIGHRDGCFLRGANADAVSVHHNSFVGTPVGVDSLDTGVLNATQNYWGASNGPSSVDDPDAPFEDPETGALADGDGASVSEHPNEDGVSNVHFDPVLTEPPAEAGASSDDEDTESN